MECGRTEQDGSMWTAKSHGDFGAVEIRAKSYVIPDPDYLQTTTKPIQSVQLGIVESPACKLYLKRGTMEDILRCCPKVTGEQIVLMQLTVPWKEHIKESNEKKMQCMLS